MVLPFAETEGKSARLISIAGSLAIVRGSDHLPSRYVTRRNAFALSSM
jgi:hypothetical protein